MPRIRTIKPEHKAHRKVGALTDRQYRVWVGMLTEADDDGRLVAEPAWLRAVIFPYHPRVSVRAVLAIRDALADLGLIRLYCGPDGTTYAAFESWRDHQRLDRAHYLPSRLPPPPTDGRDARESPASLSVDSSESSDSQGSGREPNYTGTEGKGREREGKGRAAARAGLRGPAAAPETAHSGPNGPDGIPDHGSEANVAQNGAEPRTAADAAEAVRGILARAAARHARAPEPA